MRKEKISITLSPKVLTNIDMERMNLGLSRSSYINMKLMRRRRR